MKKTDCRHILGLCKMRVLLSFFAATFFCMTAGAATLYKWIDADGNVVYQDTPPPGNVQFEESTVDGAAPALPTDASQQIEEAALANPVSLYSVPDCDSCDLVRLFLERHSIPFAEKNVRNNQDTQGELQALSGSLSVPTLIIGSNVLDGFSRIAITSALEQAGFPVNTRETQEQEQEVEAATIAGGDATASEETTAEVGEVSEISSSSAEAESSTADSADTSNNSQ